MTATQNTAAILTWLGKRDCRECYLFFVFVLLFSHSFAQNRRIDSLKSLLPDLQQDTNRVNTLVLLARELRPLGDTLTLTYGLEAFRLAEELRFARGKASAAVQLGRYMHAIEKPDEALYYLNQAIAIFKNLGRKNGIAACYNNLGGVYYVLARYDSAMAYYRKSLKLYQQLGDTLEVAKLIGNVGICQEAKGDYSSALDAYFKSLKMNEGIDYKEGVAINYQSIAINYSKQKDFLKAMEFYERALDTHFARNNAFYTGMTYNNMAPIYIEMKELGKALEVSEKALLIFRQQRSAMGEAHALNNIGSVYFKRNDLSRAAAYFKKALAARSDGEDAGKIGDLVRISELYASMGKADSALYFARQGLVIAQQIKSHSQMMSVHKALYQSYKLKGDFANATSYLEKYVADKDSIFSDENNTRFRELQLKYETEKKEQQIAILNTERSLQENRVLLLGVLVGVTLIVIAFLFLTAMATKKRQHSERLLLQEQLRNEKMEAEKLQTLDELKSRFFANIAHEFRTPLTLILGPVENLLDESRDGHSREQLRMVKNNGARLLSLVNQILDLSRLESGVDKLHFSKGDIMAFIKGVTFSFQSLAEEKEIVLQCSTSPGELTMDFDRDKMEKILSNLLSNAFKFTPDLGTITVSVTRRSQGITDNLQIGVADSGVGIPEEELPFIFNRFYQGDKAQIQYAQGSGIGLALTKELIELHAGTINVSSSENGTSFLVTLPVLDDAGVKPYEHEHYSANGTHQAITPAQSIEKDQDAILIDGDSREIILVIEDNAEVRDYIIGSLKNQYRVIAAGDGNQGIAMACDRIPDLIVSDIMMPGKNGYDVCRMLKEDQRTSHIPVILLTAKADFENKMEGLQTGADDFIAKPFSTRELQIRIRNLITTRKKLREKYLSNALTGNLQAKTAEDSFLIKVRETIELHLDDSEFSVEDLCREVGMSRTHLHRKLKALTNQSATQFIRILKLQHGQKLLREGKYNVSEVADRVGFASLTYFSSSYTSYFGYAPSAEKKNG